MTWRMILWFSQTLPPVITSLKARYHDYQQLKQWKGQSNHYISTPLTLFSSMDLNINHTMEVSRFKP